MHVPQFLSIQSDYLVNSSCMEYWLDLFVNSNKNAENQKSTYKSKHIFLKFYEKQNSDFMGY